MSIFNFSPFQLSICLGDFYILLHIENCIFCMARKNPEDYNMISEWFFAYEADFLSQVRWILTLKET